MLSKKFIIFWCSIIILLWFISDYQYFLSFGISLGISLSFYELLCITLKNVCYFLLFHYFNLSSSSCSYLFSGHTHLSLGISLSCSFVIFYEIFSDEFFETFVILLVILFPIKSLHSPAVFEQLFLKNRTFDSFTK